MISTNKYSYNADGNLSEVKFYGTDALCKGRVVFYKNGKKKEISEFTKNGGILYHVNFDQEGNILDEELYDQQGNLIGRLEYVYDNGKKVSSKITGSNGKDTTNLLSDFREKENEIMNSSEYNTTNISTPQIPQTISVGDTLKFTATAWHTKSSDGGSNTGKYIKAGDLLEIIEKGNTANYYKVKILSGELKDTETYIIYQGDSSKYFEKVESVKIEESGTDEKQTETIDKGTLSDNAVEFTKKLYMAMLQKTKEEADKNINKDSLIVKDIIEGKTDAAGLIRYFEDLERPYGDLSFNDYCQYMYKAILQKDITDSELATLKEQFGKDENFQSEILGNIINSNEFKVLCEKYSIDVGTYTVSKYNSNITEEKATTFVKNLYSTLMNKTATEADITKIVKNITDGKITASGVYKAFFESDEFKNQKVSDDKYIEMLGKVCWNKDLTDEQKREYTNKLINGTTRNELLKEFISATDCTTVCDQYGLSKGNYEASKLRSTNALATDFVKNVHNATLGENSAMISASDLGLITGSLSAADVIQLYVESSNFENRIKSENLTNSDYIKCLFKACLRRDASSADEAKQYEDKIDQAYKPSVLAEFFKLDEYKKLCNSYYLVAGSYTDNKENNQAEPKTTSYGSGGAKITTKERKLSNGQTVKYTIKVEFDTSTGLKGDLDGNNHVGIEDASLLLSYVATQELNYTKPTDDILKMADIDGDKVITIEDAQYILQYYAMNTAQLNPTWEEAIEASKKYDEDGTIPTKDKSMTEDKQNLNNNNSEAVNNKDFVYGSKAESNYKTNEKEEIEKTGIEGIFSVGAKEYKVYLQGRGPWASRTFWNATMSSDGCGPTAVATILTGCGIDVTPDEIASQLEALQGIKTPGGGGYYDSWEHKEIIFNNYGIKNSGVVAGVDYNRVKNHLIEGKPVLLTVGGYYGPRSTSGHYIAVVGYDELQDKAFLADSVYGCSGWWSLGDLLSTAGHVWYIDE